MVIDPATLKSALRVPLNGLAMQLRPSELESVAAGLGRFGTSEAADLLALAEALRRLPVNDRTPAWELAIRRFGRRKELPQAASEIGMDVVHARELLEVYFQALAVVPPPEQAPTQTL